MKKVARIVAFIMVINIAVTTIINRLKHPKKTETELFCDIPKSFIYNFK